LDAGVRQIRTIARKAVTDLHICRKGIADPENVQVPKKGTALRVNGVHGATAAPMAIDVETVENVLEEVVQATKKVTVRAVCLALNAALENVAEANAALGLAAMENVVAVAKYVVMVNVEMLVTGVKQIIGIQTSVVASVMYAMNLEHILFTIPIARVMVHALKTIQASANVFVTQMENRVVNVENVLEEVVQVKANAHLGLQKDALVHKAVHIR